MTGNIHRWEIIRAEMYMDTDFESLKPTLISEISNLTNGYQSQVHHQFPS